jgi:hypothetical protein
MKPADVTAAVEAVGFKPLAVIELPPYHYAATFERPTEPAFNSSDDPA